MNAEANAVGQGPGRRRGGAPHVLSLDLGETTLWDTREIAQAQLALRVEELARGLRDDQGRALEPSRVAGAGEEVLGGWGRSGLFASCRPNAVLVVAVRARRGATLAMPLEDLAERYSAAGLREHPPHVNPEARELVRSLAEHGVTVMAISDTSRSGRTWEAFLREVGGMAFAAVTTSCDLAVRKPDPRLFQEAARRVGRPTSDVLHVGDRFDRDVVGAEGSGMSAARYRGLWSKTWNPEEGPSAPAPPGVAVTCLDRLTEAAGLLAVR